MNDTVEPLIEHTEVAVASTCATPIGTPPRAVSRPVSVSSRPHRLVRCAFVVLAQRAVKDSEAPGAAPLTALQR